MKRQEAVIGQEVWFHDTLLNCFGWGYIIEVAGEKESFVEIQYEFINKIVRGICVDNQVTMLFHECQIKTI